MGAKAAPALAGYEESEYRFDDDYAHENSRGT